MNKEILPAPPGGGQVPPPVGDNLARYRAELHDLDVSDEQKDELLETLWRIMCSFVELGFRVDICEQFFAEFNEAAQEKRAEVEWAIPHQPEPAARKESRRD